MLTSTEQALVRAAGNGNLLDLTTGDPVRDNPATARSWGRHRQVRGDVLTQLCAGAWPVHHRGIRVRGARVMGPVDLTDVEFGLSVWLVGCGLLDGPLIAPGAHLRSLSLAGTHLPVPMPRPDQDGSGMAMDLGGAVIDRDVDLGDRFVADDGRMVMVGGFTSIGEVSIAGVHVGGLVTLRGASLANAGGTALDADGATIAGSVFLDEGFAALGEVSLTGTRIEGVLNLADAWLANDQRDALDAERLVAAGGLALDVAEHSSGRFTLSGARTSALWLPDRDWGATGFRLEGFTYDAIHPGPGADGVPVAARLAWLDTDPGYAPDKYDHLAEAYTRAGHQRAAEAVRVAKQRARRRSLRQPRRSLDWLWDLTVVYGTRTGRAVIGLFLVLVAGGQAFAAAYPVRIRAIVEEPPPFRPLLYSADLVVPLLDFGQRAYWAPTGGFVAQWSWLSVTAGWLLTIAVIVGLTGTLLRRD